jgi:hypothetical protein
LRKTFFVRRFLSGSWQTSALREHRQKFSNQQKKAFLAGRRRCFSLDRRRQFFSRGISHISDRLPEMIGEVLRFARN